MKEWIFFGRYFDEVLTLRWHAVFLRRPAANNGASMDHVIIVPALREDQSWYQVYLFANRWDCYQYPLDATAASFEFRKRGWYLETVLIQGLLLKVYVGL